MEEAHFTFSCDAGVITATLSADIDDIQGLLDFGIALKNYCEDNNCFRILVESERTNYSLLNAFDDSFVIEALAPPDNVHVAVLTVDPSNYDAYQFVVNLLKVKKLLDIDIFKNREEAVQWLLARE